MLDVDAVFLAVFFTERLLFWQCAALLFHLHACILHKLVKAFINISLINYLSLFFCKRDVFGDFPLDFPVGRTHCSKRYIDHGRYNDEVRVFTSIYPGVCEFVQPPGIFL